MIVIASQDRQHSSLTRRRFFVVAGAVGLGAGLAACGAGPEEGSSGTGSWEFADGLGETLRLNDTPSRVVAFTGSAGALADYGVRERIVGIFGEASSEQLLGELDTVDVTVIGDAWGEFDLEKYATLEPDLLVTDSYVPERLWYVPDDNLTKIRSANPNVVAVEIANQRLLDIIERYRSLAEALGADTTSAAVAAAEQRFADAAQAVRDAVAARPGLRVLAASANPQLFYVSDPRVSADLRFFTELGVDLVVPDQVDPGGFFQSLSWETADRYDADVILLDDRSIGMSPQALAEQTVWRGLPAVRAGQVAPWSPVFRFSHAATAPLLERLAATIRDANKVI
ncbi:ABC transporter substrate-binding protein [Nocardia mangyaensis]|uniref:ABC transporter substrate-binding protein n=1 Tax=Nocardia mangyaensis TaxID=2213200 RepID=A0A1J0VU05_9NOCA|nr:ABC transporter substrate-binding protein [Nocardia mangyaensis]APE35497.1 ABC transporter substrate-binding protein [Nocardia mangyaensis]